MRGLAMLVSLVARVLLSGSRSRARYDWHRRSCQGTHQDGKRGNFSVQ